MSEPSYDDLARELRAAKPRASEELRERVLTLARTEPVVERRRYRLAPFLVPALGTAAAVAAVAVSVSVLGGTSAPADEAVGGEAPAVLQSSAAQDSAESTREAAPPSQSGGGAAAEEALPPSGSRLQEYRAELRVRVADEDALSEATAEAMRVARGLGGYVVSAQLSSSPVGESGDSSLVVRVPVGRVQEAIARYSELGVLVAQDVALEDLQAQADRQDEGIAALRRTIAGLERDLRGPNLTNGERAELERRLADARRSLRQREEAREQVERRGSFARVALTLTTRDDGEALPPAPPGDFEQTIRDALGATAQLVAWILAALIVTSPLVALAALLVVLELRRRRLADERLLRRA